MLDKLTTIFHIFMCWTRAWMSSDCDRLSKAAVWAHPTLFTRIQLNDDGEPIQTIDLQQEQWSLQVEHIDDIEAVKQQLTVPFNIVGDRLFHIRLMQDAKHIYLFLDYHHIIVDGTSMQIMLQDIDKAYHAQAIEPEQLTMAQVACSEAEQRNSPAFEQAKQWYADNFNCSDTFTQIIPDCEGSVHTEDNLLRVLESTWPRRGLLQATMASSKALCSPRPTLSCSPNTTTNRSRSSPPSITVAATSGSPHGGHDGQDPAGLRQVHHDTTVLDFLRRVRSR